MVEIQLAAQHKLGSDSAQAKFRFAHLQLRLKQQLLMAKDGNGNCSCRDSDVEFPVTERGENSSISALNVNPESLLQSEVKSFLRFFVHFSLFTQLHYCS